MKKLITSITLLTLSISTLLVSQSTNASEQSPPKANTLYIALDNSGSMKNKFNWIGESLFELNHQLEHKSQLPYQIRLYGFSNKSQLLAAGDGDSIVSAIESIDIGSGTEDGLLPINQIASSKGQETNSGISTSATNAHIILYTDEARTPLKDIDFDDLLERMKAQNITLHVVVRSLTIGLGEQIINEDGINIAVKDQQSYEEAVNRISPAGLDQYYSDRFKQLCQASQTAQQTSKQAKICNTQYGKKMWLEGYNHQDSDYVKLAFATNGTVWDMSAINSNREFFAKFMSKIINGQENEIFYSPKVAVTGDTLTGSIKANQMVTFEASSNNNLMKHKPVENWAWDFNNDGMVDDQGPNVMYEFDQAGEYKVTLWSIYDSYNDIKSKRVISVVVER